MNLGTFLVLLGVVCAVLDIFLTTKFGRVRLLVVAVILIGIGVLLGPAPLNL